ncbi:tetratricopeptide repeat protein [Chthonobacter rhizosphaerae]|uniref:tetratricopeptide repeat protein n=1 Tax=Chthonobacter rhizosphaerae TaxID=2735553 RepID=UPI001FE35454|nr:tetratricopeptide repeat protein [Chthonobacter rhizosphaerae]
MISFVRPAFRHVLLVAALAGVIAAAPAAGQTAAPSAPGGAPQAGEPRLDRLSPGAGRRGPATSDRAAKSALAVDPAVELDPLFEQLAQAKTKMEAHPLEQRILRIFNESGSSTVDLLMGWADQAIAAKNYPAALDLLDDVVVLKPDFAEAYNRRATVYYMLDDYTRSMGDIRRTLALQPRHFGAMTGLGAILAELDEPERARDIYRRALAIAPQLDAVKEALAKLDETAAGRRI